MKVLYHSNEIRKNVRWVLAAKKGRRVAVVAYVGAGAEKFIPHPNGLKLICAPQAGATDPDTLERLRKKGAEVFFSDRLHSKVYWSAERGAVLGSANLTSNGLTGKGLHEMAVRIGPAEVDIDAVLKIAQPKKMTPAMLKALFKRTERYRSQNRGSLLTERKASEQAPQTFSEWFHGRTRRPWRLFVYEEYFEQDPKQVAEYIEEFDYDTWHDYWTGTAALTKSGEWYLSADMGMNADPAYWSHAQHQRKLGVADEIYSPTETHFAFQGEPISVFGSPPFKVDGRFSARLKSFLKKRGVKTYDAQQRVWPDGILPEKDLKALL